uniref:(S)-ureidoglycine aminohydrolase cupin domain-containing protein n=1 Tax=Cannabis sativa TaxID=3483 RepID=A0A803PU33_CANSA
MAAASTSSQSDIITPSSNDDLKIIVESNIPPSRLSELGKVKVYPKGSSISTDNNDFVEFGAGDLVIIPKGLSCTWDVLIAVDKHYKFDSNSTTT